MEAKTFERIISKASKDTPTESGLQVKMPILYENLVASS